MKDDFQSPLFNSYISGPGMLLPLPGGRAGEGGESSDESRQGGGRVSENIALFVDKIPLALTKASNCKCTPLCVCVCVIVKGLIMIVCGVTHIRVN